MWKHDRYDKFFSSTYYRNHPKYGKTETWNYDEKKNGVVHKSFYEFIGEERLKDDSKCSAEGGACINRGEKSCDGTIRTGICPGDKNIRCCIPKEDSFRRRRLLAGHRGSRRNGDS